MPQPRATFRRIVVPIDTSEACERAIPFALALATPGDTVAFLYVDVPRDRGSFARNQYDDDAPGAEEGAAHLADLAARIEAPEGVTIETAVVQGKPAEAIHAYQEETDADLVVMTTAGRGAAGRLRFGSVADEVFRSSAVPVVLVPLHKEEDGPDREALKRVVVPLDGSERAHHALPLAAEASRRLGLPVTVLNVMEISDLTKFDDPTKRPSPIEEIIAGDDTAVREQLTGAVAELEELGVPATWKVVSGNHAAQVIEDDIEPHDFVVMVSQGRGGVRRWLFGSVAERLVRGGSTAVMLAPPYESSTSNRRGFTA